MMTLSENEAREVVQTLEEIVNSLGKISRAYDSSETIAFAILYGMLANDVPMRLAKIRGLFYDKYESSDSSASELESILEDTENWPMLNTEQLKDWVLKKG